MSQEEKDKMHIANCQICTLAECMRDCKLCKFNMGLEQKKSEVNTVSTIQKGN